MTQRSGINRGLMWLRKVLEITEETDSPRVLSEELRPIVDVFGWERLNEAATNVATSGVNVNIISSAAVPDDTMRLVLEASVETANVALAFTLWIDHLDAQSNVNVGVMRPIQTAISAITIRAAMTRMIIMRPGDVLAGRSSPATGGVDTLVLRQRFVDLPIGEYIHF